MHYYNDHDKTCCRWLKELIARGLLPPGDVDDRSITDVKGSELDGYEQFFAGIGGWYFTEEMYRMQSVAADNGLSQILWKVCGWITTDLQGVSANLRVAVAKQKR